MIKKHLALCGSGEISGAAKGVPADEGWRPRFGRRAFGHWQEVSPPLRGVRRRSRSCYLGPFRERVSRSGVLQAAVHLLVLALALAQRATGYMVLAFFAEDAKWCARCSSSTSRFGTEDATTASLQTASEFSRQHRIQWCLALGRSRFTNSTSETITTRH